MPDEHEEGGYTRGYNFGSGPNGNSGPDKVAAAENAPVPRAATRSFSLVGLVGPVLIFLFAGPVTLLTIDFWEQIGCKFFRVMCERTKIINWSGEKIYEPGPGNQSLRFYWRSTTKGTTKEEI